MSVFTLELIRDWGNCASAETTVLWASMTDSFLKSSPLSALYLTFLFGYFSVRLGTCPCMGRTTRTLWHVSAKFISAE